MKGYLVYLSWRGEIDPDNTGTETEEFLACCDEHARGKAEEIARHRRCSVEKIRRATDDGFVTI